MINGILNIYKEKGYTSHDVVAKLRGIVGQKRWAYRNVDPDAEGVLPVCLGRATKLCDMLTDKNKTYETILLLGKDNGYAGYFRRSVKNGRHIRTDRRTSEKLHLWIYR